MKKYLYIIIIALVAAVATSVSLSGCEDENARVIKKEVTLLNAQCPVNMGMAGDLISVKYDENNRVVEFYYSVNEQFTSPAYLNKGKYALRNNARVMLADSKNEKMIKTLVNARASIKFILKIPSSGKTIDYTIDYEDLKTMHETPMSQSELKQIQFESWIALNKAQCPQMIEEGITQTDVKEEGDYVVFLCEVDEDMYDIETLRQNKEDLRKDLLNYLTQSTSDSSVRNALSILSKHSKGIIYRYYGSKSQKQVDATISPAEIASLIK